VQKEYCKYNTKARKHESNPKTTSASKRQQFEVFGQRQEKASGAAASAPREERAATQAQIIILSQRPVITRYCGTQQKQ
jgi:hypothetical protein